VETDDQATSYTCVVCGIKWGGKQENNTSGICIKCFAKWAIKNYKCFGKYGSMDNCLTCKISKYCREYYESQR